MTRTPSPDRPPAPLGPELWADDLDTAAAPVAWLWHGYLAPGNVTLLTSQWKTGKTTLVSVLLSRLGTGGEFAGRALAAGKAVVVSEESPALWRLRREKLDFGRHVCWLCRPFRGKPRLVDWLGLLDRLLALHAQFGLALVVIDPLAAFLPGHCENDAGGLLEALLPLQRLTAPGLAVLLLHHPRKKESAAGQLARGSGALPAVADILLEMDWVGPPAAADRRRRLRGFSRYDATPRHWIIELNAAGTDYVSHGDYQADAFENNWQRLRQLLATAPGKLTREQLLAAWPPDGPPPGQTTLWRWLERASADGLVCRDGTGHRNHPFRFWLAGQEEVWRCDPTRLPDLPPLPPLEGGPADPPALLLEEVRRRLRSRR